MRKIYLACPYTHNDPAVRAARARAVSLEAARLMRGGALVYSPISMGHAFSEVAPWLPYDFAFWQAQCLSLLTEWAAEVAVLALPGWEQSRGVAAEVAEAGRLGLPVVYIAPAGEPMVGRMAS